MIKISSEDIFAVSHDSQFEELALQIFNFQASGCKIYSEFVNKLGIDPVSVRKTSEIPFLPIEFFKSHKIITGDQKETVIFSSSGTGGATSRHFVTDLSLYIKSFRKGFRKFYGDIREHAILALLPSYLEREGSSLVFMADDMIQQSKRPESGYFLYNHEELETTLKQLQKENVPTILIGVTYALLDLIEKHSITFPELIVMETGGMKGKRRELVREELHEILCSGFGVTSIHSEYGMTELLSQAYSKGDGIFECPPWMKIVIRDTNDPFALLDAGQAGGINVIDLANLNSCSFIATQDLGRSYPDGSFEVLGRFDNSDIRGCNLMIG